MTRALFQESFDGIVFSFRSIWRVNLIFCPSLWFRKGEGRGAIADPWRRIIACSFDRGPAPSASLSPRSSPAFPQDNIGEPCFIITFPHAWKPLITGWISCWFYLRGFFITSLLVTYNYRHDSGYILLETKKTRMNSVTFLTTNITLLTWKQTDWSCVSIN